MDNVELNRTESDEEEIYNEAFNPDIEKNILHDQNFLSSSHEDFFTESEHKRISLTWNDLSVFVPVRSTNGNRWFNCFNTKGHNYTHKRILNNVSGAVFSGTLLAILGASGSGKTTLMTVLSGRQNKNVIIGGQIFLNGQPLQGSRQMDHIGYVFQEDLMVGSLTVKEHLSFMAALKMSKTHTSAQIQQRIEDLLIEVNLKQCEQTKIGIPGIIQGISGGEKKRLGFATEILTNPPILFCDEPTTGLDSFMAQNVISVLQNMANNGRIVVCSIHQPSSEVFAMFNSMMLLADGRTAFFGTLESANNFFKEQNLACPPNYNPADHYIHLMASEENATEICKRKIKRICDKFSTSDYGKELEKKISFNTGRHYHEISEKHAKHINSKYNSSWFTQLCMLTWRGVIDSYRNPSIALIRLGQKTILAFILSAFYYHIAKNQKGINDTLGAIYLFLTENTFPNMYGVLHTFSAEIPIFHREHKSNLYQTGAYYLAKIFTILPIFIIEPTVFILITYWLIGLNNSAISFLITWAMIILTANVASACGCCFSAMCESIDMALILLIPVDYLLMIGGGTFIVLNTLPSYVSWTQYLSWFKYANEGINIAVWTGVENITCEWGPSGPCIRTGENVLSSHGYYICVFFKHFMCRHTYILIWCLAVVYAIIYVNDEDLMESFLSLVALFFFFHLAGFLFLLRQTKKH